MVSAAVIFCIVVLGAWLLARALWFMAIGWLCPEVHRLQNVDGKRAIMDAVWQEQRGLAYYAGGLAVCVLSGSVVALLGIFQVRLSAIGFVVVCSVAITFSGFPGLLLTRARWRRTVRRVLAANGVAVCLECGYDLRATLGAACPECGHVNEGPGPFEGQ